MKHRLKSAIAALSITAASLVTAPAADAAGFTTVGAMHEHYNAGGASRGLFVGSACDQYGFDFNPKAMYSGFANWAHIVSSISVTGNGGCDGVRIYQRTNPANYWTCLYCAGKVINIAAPFNDDVGRIRFFHVTGVVI